MVDAALVVLLTAAVAFSVIDFVSGPLKLRSLINRRAVLVWLIAGLRRWDGAGRPKSIWGRFNEFLLPGVPLKEQFDKVNKGMAEHWENAKKELEKGEQKQSAGLSSSAGDEDLEQQLLRVATGGSTSACYRLEADQLAAQINAAAETVLDKPSSYQTLLVGLAGLTRNEVEPDLAKVPGRGPVSTSAYLFRATSLPREKEDPDFVLQARHELTLKIQRRLDELQINTRSYQDIASQCGFVIVGVAVAFALVRTRQALDIVITLGVLGGFVAPLLRSIVRSSSR
jgi:hypothetical protein